MFLCRRYVSLLLLGLLGCSKPAPPPEKDQATKPGVIFRGADGRELKAEDLDGATGKVKWEVIGAAAVPKEAHALHDQGRAAGSKSDWPKAIELLEAAHKKAPEWPYPIYDLAFTYLLKGDDAKAEEHYGRVDKLAPRGFFTTKTSLDCLRRQASALPPGFCKEFAVLEWVTDAAQKRKALEDIVEKLPGFAPGWKELSALLDDPAAKLHATEKGLSAKPDDDTKGILLVNKALLLDARGEHEAAVAILGELVLDPRSTMATEAMAKFSLANVTRKR